MLTTYWISLHEGFARRTGLILLALAIVMAIGFMRLWPPTLAEIRINDSMDTGLKVEVERAVLGTVARQLPLASGLCMVLSLFAAVPLLVSVMEPGWLEIVFSKQVSRWRILTARVLAGVSIYIAAFTIATAPLALYLWTKSGVNTAWIFGAVLIESLAFFGPFAVAALAGLAQRGPTLSIIAAGVIWMASPGLAARKQTYYPLFTSASIHRIIDWLYRVFPKCSELDGLAAGVITSGTVGDWWPIWSTVIFILAVLILASRLLETKSF